MTNWETRSIICIPLKSKHRVLGVIQLINVDMEGFGGNEMLLLQALADYAALAFWTPDPFSICSTAILRSCELQRVAAFPSGSRFRPQGAVVALPKKPRREILSFQLSSSFPGC